MSYGLLPSLPGVGPTKLDRVNVTYPLNKPWMLKVRI